MTAFNKAWVLVKSQRPQFNPREDPEYGTGNHPYNQEEAYEAAMNDEPVFHCPSCDAYLDKPVCLGHASPPEIEHPDGYAYRGSAFRQPNDAHLTPKGHAFMRNGRIGGHEATIPTWKMSARERWGLGYDPVPDPADVSEDQDIVGWLGSALGGLKEYNQIPEGQDKPRLRDWLDNKRIDDARKERLLHLRRLMEQTGLSADELKAMLLEQDLSESPDVRREQQEIRQDFTTPKTDDWMNEIWDLLAEGENE